MDFVITRDTNHLEHHGIKGQKWGVRRWQNDDGTYNAAGRERYGIGDGQDYNGVNKSSSKDDVQKKVKKYSEHYDRWTAKQDENDELWEKVSATRKGLGLVPNIKSKEYAAYSKMYDEWSRKQDALDEDANKLAQEYKDTGKNFVSRIVNNVKYKED